MTEFFNILSNFGFPVAVTAYLLIRFETKLEKIQEKIDSLTTAIKELETTIKLQK